GVGTSILDIAWQTALIAKVSDEHRQRYQAAHTSVTGVRGVIAPFTGSLLVSSGVGVRPTLMLSSLLAVAGAVLMARALGVAALPATAKNPLARLRRGVVGAVVGDAGRPDRDVRVGHRVVGMRARVTVAPLLEVRKVLLARQQRPAAHGL